VERLFPTFNVLRPDRVLLAFSDRTPAVEPVRQARDWRNLAGGFRAGFQNRDRATEQRQPGRSHTRINDASAPASPIPYRKWAVAQEGGRTRDRGRNGFSRFNDKARLFTPLLAFYPGRLGLPANRPGV
jgi:hypothetical protein